MEKSVEEIKRERILEGVTKNAAYLENLSLEDRNNSDIVFSAVDAKFNTDKILKYASDRLKNDENFVYNILTHNYENCQYMGEDLWDNESIVTKILCESKRPGILFNKASKRLSTDPAFVVDVMDTSHIKGHDMLNWMNDEAKQNKAVVEAVMQRTNLAKIDSSTAEKLSTMYNNDEKIMSALVEADFENAKHASDELKESNAKIKEGVEKCEAYEGFVNGEVSIGKLDKKYYTDEQFYDKICKQKESVMAELADTFANSSDIKTMIKNAASELKACAKLTSYVMIAEHQKKIMDRKKEREAGFAAVKDVVSDIIGRTKDKIQDVISGFNSDKGVSK